MSEINTMKRVAATENFLINDQSGQMQSSVLKALDFSLNIDLDDISSQSVQNKKMAKSGSSQNFKIFGGSGENRSSSNGIDQKKLMQLQQ